MSNIERWDIQVFGVDPETRAGLGELRFSVSDHGKSATVYVDIPPDPRLAGAVDERDAFARALTLAVASPELREAYVRQAKDSLTRERGQ